MSKCACEGQCSCKTDLYAENLEIVWQRPTEYEMLRHGPPYLPTELKSLLKLAADYDTRPLLEGPGREPLVVLLSYLQALSLLHQAAHWSTAGEASYGDHLLFQRLYEESQDFIDQVAERTIGSGLVPAINASSQASLMAECLKLLQKGARDRISISLRAELCCLRLIELVSAELEQRGCLSLGISNLLEGLADRHETFVYLLQQRTKRPENTFYSYER